MSMVQKRIDQLIKETSQLLIDKKITFKDVWDRLEVIEEVKAENSIVNKAWSKTLDYKEMYIDLLISNGQLQSENQKLVFLCHYNSVDECKIKHMEDCHKGCPKFRK